MTEFKLLLSPQAERELERVIALYRKEEFGLGARFECEFMAFLDIIKCRPDLFVARDDGMRTVRMGAKFPYELEYKYNEVSEEILVTTVAHQNLRSRYQ
ncbi:MAG: hypothetical protein JJ975_16325 [Bacteroidia bacterium]|nr:hypothetical protein [Bacteroidia bacterium]